MLKAYKYRIYPNGKQQELIRKQFGCCRYVYNWGLQLKMETYQKDNKNISCFDLIRKLTILKKEFPWLTEVYSQALQMSLRNLDNAYLKFFREKKGFPKFKSVKNSIQSCQYPQGVQFRDSKVFIPKMGEVKARVHRSFKGTVKTVTLSQVASGKYYIAVLVEDGVSYPEPCTFSKDTTIGVDVGIKHFATFSTGDKIEHPKHLIKAEKKLKRFSKKLSNKVKGSNNKNKVRQRLAVQYEKVTFRRKDFLHKLSKRLISENQAIAIETLSVAGMLKNRRLSKRISDSGWSTFFSFLNYKADMYGINLLEIGQFDPSSKLCSACGTLNKELTLSDRVWVCQKCKTKHDRDVNAAINIKAIALHRQNLIVPRGTRKLKPAETVQDLRATVIEPGSPHLKALA